MQEFRSESQADIRETAAAGPLCPQKRTSALCHWHVRFVPRAAVSNRSKRLFLFDYLVAEREQLVRYGEAEGLRRFRALDELNKVFHVSLRD